MWFIFKMYRPTAMSLWKISTHVVTRYHQRSLTVLNQINMDEYPTRNVNKFIRGNIKVV